MNGNKNNLTPEQEDAVRYRGGALLVSAAAGSGKTKVLVERLLGRVMEGESDIDKFLVITYTRTAAGELREKILDEISHRLAIDPDNRRLRRQSILCHAAPISTIHAFCSELLRENPQAVEGLPPDFRVADESESEIIRAEVLDDVLNEAYETINESPGFKALVDTMSAGRDDKRLTEIILDTHAKLRSNPDPEKWIADQLEKMTTVVNSDASETVWGSYLMVKARRAAKYWHSEMSAARREMRIFPELERGYGGSYDATISSLEAFISSLDRDWDSAKLYSKLDFPRVGRAAGFEDFKELRNRCKAAAKKIAAFFEWNSAEFIEDMTAVLPAVSELLKIILLFDEAYAKEKKRRGVIDFADQEHMALSILTDRQTGEKTKLAKFVSERYTEIMVDEYQDVNAVQELIFNAVSKNGENLFMVGDVKQSIYRFRLADPTIFLKKYRQYPDAPSGSEKGAKILLSKNFRSGAGILDAVNFIFERVMSQEFGEMDYTKREFLYPGRKDTVNAHGSPVELCIIDMGEVLPEEDEDNPDKVQLEAEFIANQIAELLQYGEIPDGQGGVRRVCSSDIAILLRSVRDKAWRYAAALSQRGITVDIPGGEGFFDSIEISAALSLLSVIDNPIQDIPLAAALRCPIYGFTADELAAIRAGADKNDDFYTALKTAAQTDAKCRGFLDDIDDLRAVAADMPADRFIWHVYNKTGMLAAMGALRGGLKRRDNLILLADYARRFEKSGYKGLFGFLMYIRGIKERGGDLAPDSGTSGADAVHIMSIHKSKGLEFPIVFLADTTKRLNNKDAQKPLVVHHELGAGAMRIDRTRRIEYPTPARLAVQKKLKEEMMAEELRVLYVAMTRAKEKLYITAIFKDAGRELERYLKNNREVLPPQVLEDTRSMADWILLPALTRPEAAYLRDNSEYKKPGVGQWDIRFIKAEKRNPDTTVMARDEARAESAADIPPEQIRELRKRFSFKYPYPNASELPSKLTVTELKGRFFDYEAAEDAEKPELLSDESSRRFAFERPDFIVQKTALTAAERGTAMHTAMQYIDFTKCESEYGVKKELERLREKQFLNEEQAAAVPPGKIVKFFSSDIGRRILGADDVHREFKFTLLCPAGEFYHGGGEDKILLQGVIDCYIEEQGEITVVDFKTDQVTRETLDLKTEQYKPQLREYAKAIERMTGRHVKESILYFFDIDSQVSVLI